ncbi:hypothetical protein [Altererythrobacter lutimaris]|uniref:HEAT repeat domain-containing protein n=1 Tax=Altererythrobacter lutimaris TaxID=2743979 RepID=A0A850H5W9_9SPHN|nr:hypothetical protein [Altererythrobacter lutimaris]NVE94537.1 hypothetical protein [Altererythrobacter lutimaris]
MRIDPEIAALRADPAAQRRAQNAMDHTVQDWKSLPELTPILQQFARYAAGDALEALSDLRALVSSAGAARSFIDTWSCRHVAGLRDEPLAQIPYRYSYSAGYGSMQLLAEHGATLSIAMYEQLAEPAEPTSAIFSDREQHEIVVAGQGEGLFSRLDPATGALRSDRSTVSEGASFHFDCNREMRQWISVEGRLVLLQLSRTPEQANPTRELRLSDGALLMQSDGDKRVSQSSMALAVLGALGRSDAVPAMQRLAASGPAHLRWEAVRQMIALDAFSGIAALDRIAADESDELAAPAAQLAQQLRAQYPTLRKGEAA